MKKSMVFLTIFCAGMFALNLVIDEPAQGAEIRDAAYCPCVMFCSPCPPEERDEAEEPEETKWTDHVPEYCGQGVCGSY